MPILYHEQQEISLQLTNLRDLVITQIQNSGQVNAGYETLNKCFAGVNAPKTLKISTHTLTRGRYRDLGGEYGVFPLNRGVYP